MKSKIIIFVTVVVIAGISLFVIAGTPQKVESDQPPMQMKIPVVGFKARKQVIADKISLVGTLEADEIVEIKSEISGSVEEIKFEEGQKVKEGDLLVLIDQRKLKAALDQAEANLNLAQTTSERYQSLIENGAISRQEYDQALTTLEVNRATVELTKAQLKDSTILARFDGVMGERKVSGGQFISQGTSISFLIKQDPMKAGFRVPERYLSRIQEGQAVEMKVAAYPDETFSGEVYFVDPKIDELTRTALMKARIPNPDGKLRHGMFSNLQLVVNEKQDAIVIPETALILRGDDVEVFTILDDQTASIKPVKVGIRMAGFVEITEGIMESDVVVIEGFQKLAPGVGVTVRFEEQVDPFSKNKLDEVSE